MINKITYLFLRLYSLFLCLLPRGINIIFGKIFGILLYYFFPLRTPVAKTNLKIAFPEKNKREINKLILNTYKHYGILTFEFLKLHSSKVNNNIFIIDDETKRILNNKSGIILMTAHIGNWEMILSILNQYKKVTGIVRKQKNSGGDKFFYECRLGDNVTLIPNKGSRREMLRALENGEILVLASDQNAKKHGTEIEFFGKKASIPKGAGHFYYLTNSILVVGFCILTKDFKYEFKLRELKINKNSEQKEDIIVEVNSVYSQILEDEIKKYPEQYFWFHKKWDKDIYKNDI